MRFLTPLLGLLLSAACALAAAPPSCVTVWQPTTPAGVTEGGSGTVIACENGKSLVVTNNHVLSPGKDRFGRFLPTPAGTGAVVKHAGKRHPGTVLASSQDRDLCAVLVDADLPAAPLATDGAPVGSKVTRYGIGTGEQTGTVVPHDPSYTNPSMHFVVRGRSESGDSGSAYFNARGELVAVHCGKDAAGNPRGTPVVYVRVWVREVAGPKFPRLRELLAHAAKRAIDWLFDSVLKRRRVEVVQPGPLARVVPKAVPAAPPVVAYRLITYRDRWGRTWSRWEPVAPACPGGTCPLPRRR